MRSAHCWSLPWLSGKVQLWNKIRITHCAVGTWWHHWWHPILRGEPEKQFQTNVASPGASQENLAWQMVAGNVRERAVDQHVIEQRNGCQPLATWIQGKSNSGQVSSLNNQSTPTMITNGPMKYTAPSRTHPAPPPGCHIGQCLSTAPAGRHCTWKGRQISWFIITKRITCMPYTYTYTCIHIGNTYLIQYHAQKEILYIAHCNSFIRWLFMVSSSPLSSLELTAPHLHWSWSRDISLVHLDKLDTYHTMFNPLVAGCFRVVKRQRSIMNHKANTKPTNSSFEASVDILYFFFASLCAAMKCFDMYR